MFKLGDKVIVKAKIESYKFWVFHHLNKIYKRETIEPKTGIIVGIRTLKEGKTINLGDYLVFEPTKYIKVYLVALNMSQIIKVLPEDIEKC